MNKLSYMLRSTSVRLFSTGAKKRVAVVLSGCGVYDGSEIQEAVFTLARLSRQGANVECFAPDYDQQHCINHITGEDETYHVRNIKVESARISRGSIASLADLQAADFDAVIFPGGFGAAKNLSNWGLVDGDKDQFKVAQEVERVVTTFSEAEKALGFLCISPVIAAKCIPGVELTVGMASGEQWPYCGAAGTLRDCGATVVELGIADGCHVDAARRV